MSEEGEEQKEKIKMKIPKNNSEIKSEGKVFVKKKILSDDEWFAGIGSKELKFYKKNMGSEEKMEENTIVCTACYRQINHKIPGMVLRHPDLGVPVCKQCKKFYHGEWTRDADGYFEFCRWCANGGDLLLCDCCSNAFCKKCIKRNLGRSKVSQIEDLEEWQCLVCDSSQVWKQRAMYYSVYIYLKKQKSDDEKKTHKKKEKTLAISERLPQSSFFLDETIRDCFDVHKILGNYLERANKSWAKKRDDYQDDDVIKATVKLRTIFNITHHNLQLLDKNLVSGCCLTVPGTSISELRPGNVPGLSIDEDVHTNHNSMDFTQTHQNGDTGVQDQVKQELQEIHIDSTKKEKKLKTPKKIKKVEGSKNESVLEEEKKIEVDENTDAKDEISRTTSTKMNKSESSEDDNDDNHVEELDASADMFQDEESIQREEKIKTVEENEECLVNGNSHAKGDIILDTRRISNMSPGQSSASDVNEQINKETILNGDQVCKVSVNKEKILSAKDERDEVSTAVLEKNDKETDCVDGLGSKSVDATQEVCDEELPGKEIKKCAKVKKSKDSDEDLDCSDKRAA